MEVTQSYVAQLENADVLPSHKKLKSIARILKASLLPPQIVIDSPTTLAAEPATRDRLYRIVSVSASADCTQPVTTTLNLNNRYDYQVN
jgi:transcriptional regulator with XRE-family HTH domain